MNPVDELIESYDFQSIYEIKNRIKFGIYDNDISKLKSTAVSLLNETLISYNKQVYDDLEYDGYYRIGTGGFNAYANKNKLVLEFCPYEIDLELEDKLIKKFKRKRKIALLKNEKYDNSEELKEFQNQLLWFLTDASTFGVDNPWNISWLSIVGVDDTIMMKDVLNILKKSINQKEYIYETKYLTFKTHYYKEDFIINFRAVYKEKQINLKKIQK